MNIDFNNVRKQALFAHDKLVRHLNSSIHRNDEYAEFPNGRHGNLKGCVVIDAGEIDEVMNDLRQMIGIIAATYEPDDENFKEVYSEVYKEGDKMQVFDPESGEDKG